MGTSSDYTANQPGLGDHRNVEDEGEKAMKTLNLSMEARRLVVPLTRPGSAKEERICKGGLVWDVLILSACRGGEIVWDKKEHSTVHPSPSELSWENTSTESHGLPPPLALPRRWTVVTPMSSSRSAAGVTVFEGRIYVSGGHDGLQIFNSVSLGSPWAKGTHSFHL